MRVVVAALFILFSLGQVSAQQWHPMVFKGDAPGIDENPLRGFVPYADSVKQADAFPHSMEWFYLPLSAVVDGPDSYHWSPLEHKLNRIAARGHQAVFRFYLDYPAVPGGIPQYLLDAGLRTFPYDDFGNATAPTPSVAPDYTDPRLVQCLVHFIQAFGAKYDGDPRIAYITAGLYGFWGEWHVNDHPRAGDPAGWTISQADKDRLLQSYVDSFHHTPVEVRSAAATLNPVLLAHFGMHDDSFLQDTLGPTAWHFWPISRRAGATENWQSHPTGGEIRPEVQPHLFDVWPNNEGEDLAKAMATIHPTWMLDGDLFIHPLQPAQYKNALRAERLLGYTLFCSAVRIARNPDETSTVSVRLENRGIAPIAYAWPIEVEALNAESQSLTHAETTWPLPTLLPGQSAVWSLTMTLPPKTATLVLRITNPLKTGNSVAFANEEMGTILPGWLTLPVESARGAAQP